MVMEYLHAGAAGPWTATASETAATDRDRVRPNPIVSDQQTAEPNGFARRWLRLCGRALSLVDRDAVFVVESSGEFCDLIRVDIHRQGVVLGLESGVLCS